MFFRKDEDDISPVANILLSRARKGSGARALFLNTGVWRRVSFFARISLTIKNNPNYFKDLPKVAFQWSEKRRPPEGYIHLFCEHGWLPRSGYQISASGVNQNHHLATILADASPDQFAQREFKALPNFSPPSQSDLFQSLTEKPFFLFALQLIDDLNFFRSGTEFLCRVKNLKHADRLIKNELSDYLHQAAPGKRIVFLQHPAEKPSPPLRKLAEGHFFVPASSGQKALHLGLSPQCQGIITINSNTFNEALLHSIPVYQLGDFLTKKFPNPFFAYNLEQFLQAPAACMEKAAGNHYLNQVVSFQYSDEDFMDPLKLRELIIREINRPLRLH